MRLVLDTDVVVAAMRSPSGASAAILDLALDNDVTLLANVALALEYEAVLSRDEHRQAAGLSIKQLSSFIDGLISILEPVPTHFAWRPQLRDPNDEMVLEAGINGAAKYIVTFNQKDFKGVVDFFDIDVSAPRLVLNLLQQTRGKLK
jgi:putative PIN family toxin of toxin-antitoxin system